MEKKKGFHMPTAYTTLFFIIIIVAILTWIIPTGMYNYKDGENVIDSATMAQMVKDGGNAADYVPIPGTYEKVDGNPQGFFDIIMAPANGFFDAADIFLFILMIGGFINVTISTGAMNSGIASIVRSMKGKEKLLIVILMCLFSLGGTIYGMAEETIGFYPLVVPVLVAAGFDPIAAAATVLLGAGIGCLGSTINPFATAIASDAAGISLSNGLVHRLVLWVIFTICAIVYVVRYGEKVKKNPSLSIMGDYSDIHYDLNTTDNGKAMSGRDKLILTIFGVTFLVMIYSVIPWGDFGVNLPELGWWFGELSMLFFASSLIMGIVNIATDKNYGEKEYTDAFIAGASDILCVGLVIALARGITVVMADGLITDTILYGAESAVAGLSSIVLVNVSFLLHLVLSFFIPSTSGLAVLSMPILAPVAEFANTSKSLIVTGYQIASGILNLFTPTSGVVMGGLAIAQVPYDKWLKFIIPFCVFVIILTMICLSILAVL